jgi:hypothetical protein
MKADFWLERIPLWGVFALSVVVVAVSIWVGTFLGNRRRRKPDHESESSIGSIIGAMLGLLAFMLAFTFGIVSERFQVRRQFLLDEVNAVQTAYLRAELLLEPHRSEIQKMLREYVDTRVELVKLSLSQQLARFKEMVLHSQKLQDQMWQHAIAMAAAERSSEIDALFIGSLNEIIDLHNSRLTVYGYRIHRVIWYVLGFITILSMGAAGYQTGLSDKSSLKMGMILALTFSAVIFLIADMDRATGMLRVNQTPLFELQKKMNLPAGTSNQPEKRNRVSDNTDRAFNDRSAGELSR